MTRSSSITSGPSVARVAVAIDEASPASSGASNTSSASVKVIGIRSEACALRQRAHTGSLIGRVRQPAGETAIGVVARDDRRAALVVLGAARLADQRQPLGIGAGVLDHFGHHFGL